VSWASSNLAEQTEPGIAPAAAPAEVSLSVVIPLLDHRGFAARCLDSWIDQSLPSQQFEIVALSPGKDQALERMVRAKLRPHDQFIVHRTDSPMELFDLGARRARGELLVFTESHCAAGRSTLEAFVTHLSRSSDDGAFCTSTSGWTNPLARAEGQVFDRGFVEWTAEGGWNRFYTRGTILKRSVYLAAGGIMPRYGCFAEPAFAAALHAGGFRLGHARDAVIQHFNTTSYRDFDRCARDFAHGQCESHRDAPQHFVRYHQRLGEHDSRTLLNARLARIAWRDAVRLLVQAPDVRVRWRSVRALAEVASLAALGLSPMVLERRWRAATARAALRMLRFMPRDLDRRYERAWTQIVTYERMRWTIDSLAREPLAAIGLGENTIARIPDAALFGFHGLEESDRTRFRWTSSVALVQTILLPGRYTVTLDTGGFRSIEPETITLALDGHLIASADIQINRSSMQFPLHIGLGGADQAKAFMLLSDPMPSRMKGNADPRPLGLPLTSLRIVPDPR
jgi:hypothetical protein